MLFSFFFLLNKVIFCDFCIEHVETFGRALHDLSVSAAPMHTVEFEILHPLVMDVVFQVILPFLSFKCFLDHFQTH